MNLNLTVKTQQELDKLVEIFGIDNVINSADYFSDLFLKYYDDLFDYVIKLSNGDKYTFSGKLRHTFCVFPNEFIELLLENKGVASPIGAYLYGNNISPSEKIKTFYCNLGGELFYLNKDIVNHILGYVYCDFYSDLEDYYLVNNKQFLSEDAKNEILNLCSAFAISNYDDEFYFLSKEYYTEVKKKVDGILKIENDYFLKIKKALKQLNHNGVTIKQMDLSNQIFTITFICEKNLVGQRKEYVLPQYTERPEDFPKDINDYIKLIKKHIDEVF